METLQLTSLTHDFYSGDSGMEVGRAIDQRIAQGNMLNISFRGIESMGPSFVNGAFIYPMELYGVNYVRNHIKLVEAKPSVANLVGTALRTFSQQQQAFYDQVKTNSVYVSASSQIGHLMRQRLTEGVAHHIRVSHSDTISLSAQSCHAISAVDFFIGIIYNHEDQVHVLEEVDYALKHHKKALLLARKGLKINVQNLHDRVQIIRFDSENPAVIIRDINQFVLERKVNPPSLSPKKATDSNDIVNLVALGALAVLLLAALFPPKDDR